MLAISRTPCFEAPETDFADTIPFDEPKLGDELTNVRTIISTLTSGESQGPSEHSLQV